MATTRPHEPDYRSPQNARMQPPQDTPPDLDSPATQLDFYQAMADFKHMFPNMDEEVIEAVLRTNGGAVDATIDQLLTMNSDCAAGIVAGAGVAPSVAGVGSARMRRHRPPKEKSTDISCPHSPRQSLTDSMAPPPYPAKSPVDAPPPSYQDYTRSLSLEQAPSGRAQPPRRDPDNLLDTPVPTAEVVGATGGDETTPKLPLPAGDLVDPPPAPLPQLPDKMPLFNHDYTPRHQLTPKRLYKGWNPPLLGRLPDDFLRITITPECHHHCHHHSHPSPANTAANTLPNRLSSPNPPVLRSKGQRSQSRSSSQASSPRPSSTDGRSPRISPRCSASDELSSELLQQKLAENERARWSSVRRGGDADPTAIQLLEDERMALIIQNEEFLVELMGDEDFMKTLERDHMNATAFEPPTQEQPELDSDRPKSDFMEGYGDDRDVTLGAFPFDRNAAEGKDKKTADFRRKLNNMGGSSKKKMMTAARKFFHSRKKKSSKQLLKENTAPSTANLLEEEEVYHAVYPMGGPPEPSPQSHVSYGDWYNSY